MVAAPHKGLRLSPLDRKVLRDIWRMKGQALAIALVIGLGVLMLVMMDGLVNSLSETKRAYYERYRLADVFAPVKRAPKDVLTSIADLPGVAAVEGRVNGAALIDLPGVAVPVRARAISLPEFEPPRLNDVYLTEGRRLDPAKRDEILLLDGFAKAHQLGQGDKLAATMNGRSRVFTIVGLVQAPEFLYSAAPGEMVPDDARFAVIWMSEKALAAAFDVDGAFNEALVALTRTASLNEVLAEIDALLDPYGGVGAYGLEDHFSNRFISEEISGLIASRQVIPPIFLAVAAFLLYIVISRMIAAEREQIGLLKAFGYTSFEVGLHYFKFIMVVAVVGAALGCLGGVLSGRELGKVYQLYYKFPFLVFRVDPAAFVIGVMVSITTASAGGLVVLRNIFALAPAVAMHPPAPPDYSRAARFSATLERLLDQPSRMVLRRLMRQPLRSSAAALGIGAGMALSVAMLTLMSAFDVMLDLNFTVMDRSDVTVTFAEPLADKTRLEIMRMDGVIEAEPVRHVAAVLRHGLYSYRGGLSGLHETARLNRAVDADSKQIFMRGDGIILSRVLADILNIKPGDDLEVEVKEGRRPHIMLPVIGVADSLLGAPAYMEMEALNRALKEPGGVSGLYLRVDALKADAIYHKLKNMPVVAGVALRGETRAAMKELMDSGAGAMRYIITLIAGIITFGIVYNSARIAYAERSRDLASLRVMGFTKGEASFVLLGELAVISLAALPIGFVLGYYLSFLISAGFSTDIYQIPTIVSPVAYGQAAVAVLVAAAFSGLLVAADMARIDLVTALKTRE